LIHVIHLDGLFIVSKIFTLRVKALQAGELLCVSVVSPVAKQLCRLAAELEQEAEDEDIRDWSFCFTH
jgi:hypothetical protein